MASERTWWIVISIAMVVGLSTAFLCAVFAHGAYTLNIPNLNYEGCVIAAVICGCISLLSFIIFGAAIRHVRRRVVADFEVL